MTKPHEETTEETYDFEDFRFGDELEDALGAYDQLQELADKARDGVEAAMRRVLQEAFAAFRDQGSWMFHPDKPGVLLWANLTPGGGFWGDDFPVEIRFPPKCLVELVRCELIGDLVSLSKGEIAKALAEWREALEQAERLLRSSALL